VSDTLKYPKIRSFDPYEVEKRDPSLNFGIKINGELVTILIHLNLYPPKNSLVLDDFRA